MTYSRPDSASFLSSHFAGFMDAYRDGMLRALRIEDLTLRLPAGDDERAAASYCVANDLDVDTWAGRLLAGWRELRRREPPPIPPNVILGGEGE